MATDELLMQVKSILKDAFGERLRGVVLYGSEARGQAGPDSDIDFLVLLDGQPSEPHDSWTCIDALYDLVLELGRPIHAEPVNIADYQAGEFPLYSNASREGILL
ncbi:MAG: nucleotidyltransferase domain-containing protein [Phycisphaerae bacterium]|nr:nucleotidyltransferase domain-containing protein [Phycisphaerae bacterium]